MSGAHDAHGDHAAAAHHDDAAHHHDFDNEPAHELPPEEPRTPGWIPILGLALFFLAGTAWLVMGSGDEDTTKAADQQPAAAQANEGAQAPAPPQPQAPAPQARPAPAPPAGSGALRQLTPDQAKEIQKQIEAIQRRGPQPQQPPQGAPAER
jgi:hypothetical protein